MLIKKASGIASSEVTPEVALFEPAKIPGGRAGSDGGGAGGEDAAGVGAPSQKVLAGTKLNVAAKSPFSTTEEVTPYNDVTHYNNFYEFGTGKEDPAKNATNFRTSPWSVKVSGLVDKPRTFTLEELQQLAPLEERIYRHRCVEAWSIVVPWIGYSFNALLKEVSPQPKAKFVAFESYYSPSQMPMASYAGIDFPLR
jgi:sulfoxide reductase catalytic subunit YedY